MSVPGRITHSMMSSTMLGDLQRANSEIAKLSRQISTGQKLSSPSSDPLGTHRALRIQSELDSVDGYRNGAQAASGWTATAEAALDNITSIVHRARELIVQASNDTYNSIDRTMVADELEQLIQQVKSNANTRYGDQYVFSGQMSTTPPYTVGASDAYAGDLGVVQRAIGAGQTVAVNVPGVNIFGSGGGDGLLIDTLRNAIADLTAGTPAAMDNLRSTGLDALNQNLDTVLSARAQLGTANNRATLALTQLDTVEMTASVALQDVAGVDLAAAITSLTTQRTAYQAALQVSASVIQPSLMDFLR